MAVIENANTSDAFDNWVSQLKKMDRAEMMAQQLTQRGAEHALMELQKLGVTAQNCADMLDSLRHGLMTIHEVAYARGIELVSYSHDEFDAQGAKQ